MRALKNLHSLAGVAIMAVALAPATASAQAETLETAMTDLAGKVVKYLEDHKEGFIDVGSFQGPPILPNSNGQAIQTTLTKCLTATKKCEVKRGGREIRGTYLVSDSMDKAVVQIRASIYTRAGVEDIKFWQNYGGEQAAEAKAVVTTVSSKPDVVTVTGTSVDLTTSLPGAGASDKTEAFNAYEKRLVAATTKTAVNIASSEQKVGGQPPINSVVSATASSPYRIEILVKNRQSGRFEPRPAADNAGLAFVTLGFADEYAVRIINGADHDVGVKLFIDTVSMFEFSQVPAYRELQMVWIGAGSSGVVAGWHVNDFNSKAFVITQLPDAVAFKRNVQPGDIGAVTAQFYPSWTGDKIPRVELLAAKAKSANAGTGMGRDFEAKYQKKIAHFGGTLLGAVTVRYEVPASPPADLPTDLAPNK